MILVKTDAGQQVLKDRSVRLTPRQRSAFILCDGKRSVDEVLAAGMGIGRDDIDQMIELGLLGPMDDVVAPVQRPAPVAAVAPMAAPVAPALIADPPAVAPVRLVSESAMPAASVASAHAGALRSRQQRYQVAYPIATRLTGGLGLRGFRLNLAVEGSASHEELLALAPKIRSAVGPEKAAELDRALGL